MRLGPAAISPRSPAVPNARRVSNRSASCSAAAASPAFAPSTRAASSARVSGSGSWASQASARARRSAPAAVVCDIRCLLELGDDVGEQLRDHGLGGATGLDDLLVAQRGELD